MRVRHLTDFEIQGLLDRRGSAPMADVPGPVYLKDLEAQEHLDNCPICRSEVDQYRELYGTLEQANVCFLPRNFARKVTFSLPPFKAQRTRVRLQTAAAWGLAGLVSLIWYLGHLNWSSLLAEVSLFVVPQYLALKMSLMASISLLSLPQIVWPSLWPPAVAFLASVWEVFVSEGGATNLIALAATVLVLIGSLDRLFLASVLRQRDIR